MKVRPVRTLAAFLHWTLDKDSDDFRLYCVWDACPERPDNNSMVMEIERDADGKEIKRLPYVVSTIDVKGQGYPLSNYMPKSEAKTRQFVNLTFQVQDASETQQSAVVELREDMKKEA